MIYQKNSSTLNIAYWFYNKSKMLNKNFSEQKLQYLLFLSQMHYSVKYEKLLMPSLFVYSRSGIYDPSIRTIMDYGFPLMPQPQFDDEIKDFLNLIWQKYSSQSEAKLQEFIYSLKCFKHFYGEKNEIIINPLNLVDSFSSSQTEKKSASSPKSKIMISQNGPVKVSTWAPRKLNQ